MVSVAEERRGATARRIGQGDGPEYAAAIAERGGHQIAVESVGAVEGGDVAAEPASQGEPHPRQQMGRRSHAAADQDAFG